MAKRSYTHSAYWYAYHGGYTHSDAGTYTGRYLDLHTYRPRLRGDSNGEFSSREWFARRNSSASFDSTFNPLLFGACLAADIGCAMRDTVRRICDPEERALMKAELRRNLRIVRRPFYYAREKKRRRELAAERRKILRRSTTAPMPTPRGLLAAWNVRKESKESMIRLGGMLHDLACYVDSSLRIDGNGDVVGRNGGIRGWLRENLPELAGKYKTLMRYKAMAIRLRQATQTMDPTPTAKLLKHPQPEIVKALLKDVRTTFSSLEAGISFYISPATIFAEKSSLFRSKKRLRRVGKDIRKRFLKKVV